MKKKVHCILNNKDLAWPRICCSPVPTVFFQWTFSYEKASEKTASLCIVRQRFIINDRLCLKEESPPGSSIWTSSRISPTDMDTDIHTAWLLQSLHPVATWWLSSLNSICRALMPRSFLSAHRFVGKKKKRKKEEKNKGRKEQEGRWEKVTIRIRGAATTTLMQTHYCSREETALLFSSALREPHNRRLLAAFME